MRIIGIDPGLNKTGWGVIESVGNRVSYIAAGTISPHAKLPMADRLKHLHRELEAIMLAHKPEAAAVEEVFVNVNARSSLKLGQARGIALLVPACHGMAVGEYSATQIKKAIVGTGRAEKQQVMHMVKTLLPRAQFQTEDTADALAVALTHAHIMHMENVLKRSA